MDLKAYESCSFKGRIKEMVMTANALRSHKENPVDVSFGDIVQAQLNLTMPAFWQQLGINLHQDTIQNIVTLVDVDTHWIIPEIFREALLLGVRNAPIWPNIVAGEEPTQGLTQIMPYLQMSDAAPRKVGEAETIPLGTISHGQKSFSIYKVGRGIALSYEILQYANLNVVSMFLQDFGIKLGHALDTLAIDCLINGEQADGSESAPVIGITTPDTKVYRDLLRIWLKMSLMGRNPTTIIGGELAAMDTLNLAEFKNPVVGTPLAKLNLKTPMPTSANYYVYGNITEHQEIILDPAKAMLKFNAQPLMVESEKIVSNQTQAFYASLTSGFAKMFRDAAVIMDTDIAFSGYGFPTYMNIDPSLLVEIL